MSNSTHVSLEDKSHRLELANKELLQRITELEQAKTSDAASLSLMKTEMEDAAWVSGQLKNLLLDNTIAGVESLLQATCFYLKLELLAIETEPSMGSLSLSWHKEGGISLEALVSDYETDEHGEQAFKEIKSHLDTERNFDLNTVSDCDIPILSEHFKRMGVKSYLFIDLQPGKENFSFLDVVGLSEKRTWTDREKKLLRTIGEAMILVVSSARSQQRFDYAMEASGNGTWDHNLLTGEVYIDQVFASMIGYRREELPTTMDAFKELVCYKEDVQGTDDKLEQLLRSGKVNKKEEKFRIKHKLGYDSWILLKVTYVDHDKNGRPARRIGSCSDISDFVEYERNLEVAKAAAEKSVLAKSAFLANMSHEIRTPMNSILGFLSVVLDSGRLPDDLAKHIRTSHSSAESLLVIINDILDISKFENGSVSLEGIDFKLYDSIVRSMEMQENNCLKKDLLLSVEYDSRLSLYYHGDPTRLKQVLINLIGNAVKFTNHGSIVVSAEPGENEGRVHFSIADTGIGIAPERMASIFESFTQADESTTRRFGGTGLGTTISKQIVEAMGGRIWVESELGRGSVFHFEINLSSVEDHEVLEPHEEFAHVTTVPEEARRIFSILLVDDVEQNLELGELRLDEQGHKVDLARNGLEAVNAYKKNHYDVILMDIQMPVMDGLEASEKIRELEQKTGKHVPIVALTASVLQEDLELCYRSGMDDIVGKPIHFNELFAVLENVVTAGVPESADTVISTFKSKESASADSDKTSFEVDLSSLSPVADVAAGVKMWHKPTLYLKNINTFICENENTVMGLRTLITQSNYKEIIRVAHALKGVAGNLSMLNFAEHAREIDLLAIKLRDCLGSGDSSIQEMEQTTQQLAVSCSALQDEYCKAKPLVELLVSSVAERESEKAPVITRDFDRGEAVEKLTRLSQELQIGSVDDVLLESCCSLLSGHVESKTLTRLSSLIDGFDFDGAATQIDALLGELGAG